ncbi:MAG: 4-alpha-glucanotransferase, partial [Candidatus Omnitrophica bacterium]|nr:4-alpha-glucanotransferase [Candidatus Omnitrophota bacterium]
MKKRASGVLLHITSLPSDHGIGDLGPVAHGFVDFLNATKQSYWQILPVNPTDNASGNSPYYSNSAFAGNPLMISFERLIGEGLIASTDVEFPPESQSDQVNFEKIYEYRMGILEKAFKSFQKTKERGFYDVFCESNAFWLDDYALFLALKNKFGGAVWVTWPEEVKNREAKVLDSYRKEYEEFMEKIKFFQYLFFKQWTALRYRCNKHGIKIIGDVPIYVSFDSVDVWCNPGLFKLDENKKPVFVSGVPPDYFSATGQLWNNPVYDWKALEETNFNWWVKRLEITFSRFDVVRIDHFRGLVKYWSVPASEETAINGTWEEVPVYKFLDRVLERFPFNKVIAEDLGVITPDVVDVMKHYGFPGMKVLQFTFGCDDPDQMYLPHNYERNCVVYTGTHDNNTTMGWFSGEARDDEKNRFYRYVQYKGDGKDIHWEMIKLAGMSVADIAITPIQDVLGLGQEGRMNKPGTCCGNWSWRLRPWQLNEEHIRRFRELTERVLFEVRLIVKKKGPFFGFSVVRIKFDGASVFRNTDKPGV